MIQARKNNILKLIESNNKASIKLALNLILKSPDPLRKAIYDHIVLITSTIFVKNDKYNKNIFRCLSVSEFNVHYFSYSIPTQDSEKDQMNTNFEISSYDVNNKNRHIDMDKVVIKMIYYLKQ